MTRRARRRPMIWRLIRTDLHLFVACGFKLHATLKIRNIIRLRRLSSSKYLRRPNPKKGQRQTREHSRHRCMRAIRTHDFYLMTHCFSLRKWAFRQSRPFLVYIILGIAFALLEATVWPLFSLVFAQAIANVVQKSQSARELALWCGLMFLIGVGNVISSFFRLFFTNIAGGKLTKHLRGTVFQFIVQQDASWFDNAANSQGMQ